MKVSMNSSQVSDKSNDSINESLTQLNEMSIESKTSPIKLAYNSK